MPDIGVGEEIKLGRTAASTAAATPSDKAQSFPDQPGGKARAETTRRFSLRPKAEAASRAISAVPSWLWSSTSTTENSPG